MSDRAASPKRVLVTGSTGAIGQPLSRYLTGRGHTVRGLARRPTPGLTDFVVGDLADREAVRRAVNGMDTVVHLGAYPNPADFIEVLLGPNVVGLYHICEAADSGEHGAGYQRAPAAGPAGDGGAWTCDRQPLRADKGLV